MKFRSTLNVSTQLYFFLTKDVYIDTLICEEVAFSPFSAPLAEHRVPSQGASCSLSLFG